MAPGENKKNVEKKFILGPFWVVCSIPHDATYYFYLSNNQFQMLYDMVVTPFLYFFIMS